MLRKPQHHIYWLGALKGYGGIAEVSDAELPPELKEIIQVWRMHYTVRRPKNQDIKCTLEDLIACDDDQVLKAVSVMEAFTGACLDTGALRLWRQENRDEAPPPDWFKLNRWPPERIREAARAALESLPRKDGRPPKRATDFNFAKDLVRYWWAKEGQEPKITVKRDLTDENEFLRWAKGMFKMAGRKGSYSDGLAVTLWKAKKLVFPKNGNGK